MTNSNLREVAAQTAQAVAQRFYEYDGRRISIALPVAASLAGTRLYRPLDLEDLPLPRGTAQPLIEVTSESTVAAALRLTGDVLALNFASARNPGGGWLGGARAQEESIARASALVITLESQAAYYAANRSSSSTLYTDHLIYSPRVPVFRDDGHRWLPGPRLVSFITSPAPNAGAISANDPASLSLVEPTLRRRVRQVLAVAAENGHRQLVLGAWGCGAFRCDPAMVSQVFRETLTQLAGAFDRIVFAIYGGRPGTDTFGHFVRAFSR